MATKRERNWLDINIPKLAYGVILISGMIFIWFAKIQEWSASYTIGVPVAMMLGYFLVAAVIAGFRFHDEQAGDNLYYMGFLFTLTSLGVALFQFNTSESIDGIVQSFGLAVVTTICGVALRIAYNQVRSDPIDIERTTRHELAEMTRRVRAELETASREFSNFRRVSNQMLEEGFEEIGRQAEQSGAHILSVLDSLTQEAIKPIKKSGDQISEVLDTVATMTETRLANVSEQLVASTTGFEEVSAKLSDSIGAFGDQVETTRAKLAAIKTPDEVIDIKLKPTLSTLEKLIKVHAQRLDASEKKREEQTKIIQQTQQSIEKLVSVVQQTVDAMDKSVTETNHSQRATENLSRMIQQQNNELKAYLEKITSDRNESLSRRIVDRVSTGVLRNLSPVHPSPTAILSENITGNLPNAGVTPPESSDHAPEQKPVEHRKWWPLR